MFEKYKKLLTQYVAFKSISTDEAYKPEMLKTANWLMELLGSFGFKTKLLKGKFCNPIVFAEYVVNSKFETVLIYGHYDVQPAEKVDGWGSDPFKLVEIGNQKSKFKNKFIARGVVDNKGQNLIHIVAIGELIKQGKLKYNVKFMIEGNEETANPDIPQIVTKNKKLLQSDYIMISDGEIHGTSPTIEASLRGGFSMTVTYITGKTNLHSGLFGGAIPNAAHELTKLVASLYDKNNRVVIPGFYDGVINVDSLTKNIHKKLHGNGKHITKLAGVQVLCTEKGCDFYTQTGLRPTIQATGIKTGYIGDGYANIVPAMAEARLNVRVVSPQNPAKVFELIKKYIKIHAPKHVSVSITHTEFNQPILVDINNPKVKEVRGLLKKVYKKEPLVKYVGGSIPIVADFKKLLGVETLLVSLGNDDCNMHGIDENFSVDLIKKGLDFSTQFFSK
ncbi:hypothetical protein A3J61_00090 [Candidatus Nomurabacteria bacterium RIFCSPHIGHO2_02_FULL_38_15]|uniref:Peptidase M20 dimerisation domain-containing protein n=1 Tax=Candidatus Nomurabacteria bacterium RIFCSPHIGHO2_02_FULL_38_15 TaxID=1801752 RepID=A0A1F6VQ01_9BACT|nr:MAG: hypothetical protein A3J61_00090 [Candidatus Nomurabacteria bacterium RIFCSPHIGHO2_02_FULL_38_15]